MFITNSKIILASNSPRRHDFFYKLGLDYMVALPPDEEPKPFFQEEPASFVQRAAEYKAMSLCQSFPECSLVGADTIVVVDREILGKPLSAKQALSMLKKLVNKEHTVLTACSVFLPEKWKVQKLSAKIEKTFCNTLKLVEFAEKRQGFCFYISSQVEFADFSVGVLKGYVASKEPFNRAGAYAIQGLGAFLVKKVQGSVTNVIGLPVAELLNLLLWQKVISSSN